MPMNEAKMETYILNFVGCIMSVDDYLESRKHIESACPVSTEGYLFHSLSFNDLKVSDITYIHPSPSPIATMLYPRDCNSRIAISCASRQFE